MTSGARCLHWRGIFDGLNRGLPMAHRACAAGVRYQRLAEATRPTEPGWNERLPCWGRTAEQGARPCGRYERTPDAELEALERRVRLAAAALPGLVTQIQGSFRGVGRAEGRAPCPSGCGGTVAWTLDRDARGRESCVGECETPGCVRWSA